MTGLDALRDEMLERGLCKSQIESKTAAVVLDIVANSGTKYTEMWQNEVNATRETIALEQEARGLRFQIQALRKEKNNLEKEVLEEKRIRDGEKTYIDDFMKALNECETKEGRDAMRRAQVFVNSINIETDYDNYAFIDKLGLILSNGEFGDIKRLVKIEDKPTERQEYRIV